jgi:uncharacterized protein
MRVFLGHGASGDASSMAPFVEGLRRRGYDAAALSLPVRKAEDAIPVLLAQVPDEPGVVIGGHSYGGRVASLVAAGVGTEGRTHPFAGLVCYSYPLHRPGDPTHLRIDHWPAISCPVLLVSGEADPFARIELLRTAVRKIPRAELVTYPGVRHGVKPVLDEALDRTAAFLEHVAAG